MNNHTIPNCFYRVSVKALSVQGDKLMLVKESDKLSGLWELPGGGLDYGEDPKEGLKREIEEETGLEITSISPKPVYIWTNYFEKKGFHSIVLAYEVEYKNHSFIASDECEEIGFFSVEELQNLKLHKQAEKLRKIFNPHDF